MTDTPEASVAEVELLDDDAIEFPPLALGLSDTVLNGLKEQCTVLDVPIDTDEQYIVVKSTVSMLTKLRTALEKRRKKIKAPFLDRGKEIDTEAKRLTMRINEIENPLVARKKVVDDRIAAEAAEAERKAKERMEAISDRIQNIQKITAEAEEYAARGDVTNPETVAAVGTFYTKTLAAFQALDTSIGFDEFERRAEEVKANCFERVIEAKDRWAERIKLREEREEIERQKQQLADDKAELADEKLAHDELVAEGEADAEAAAASEPDPSEEKTTPASGGVGGHAPDPASEPGHESGHEPPADGIGDRPFVAPAPPDEPVLIAEAPLIAKAESFRNFCARRDWEPDLAERVEIGLILAALKNIAEVSATRDEEIASVIRAWRHDGSPA